MNGAWKKNENSPTSLNKSQTEIEKKIPAQKHLHFKTKNFLPI